MTDHKINKYTFMGLSGLVQYTNGAFDIDSLKKLVNSSYRSELDQVMIYLQKKGIKITEGQEYESIIAGINQLIKGQDSYIDPGNMDRLVGWLGTDEAKDLLGKAGIPLTSHHIDGGALDLQLNNEIINILMSPEGQTWIRDFNIEFYHPAMSYENFKDKMTLEEFNALKDKHGDHIHLGFRQEDINGDPIENIWTGMGLNGAIWSNIYNDEVDPSDNLLYFNDKLFENIKTKNDQFKNFSNSFDKLGKWRDYVETKINKDDPNYSIYFLDKDNDQGLKSGYWMKLKGNRGKESGSMLWYIPNDVLTSGDFTKGVYFDTSKSIESQVANFPGYKNYQKTQTNINKLKNITDKYKSSDRVKTSSEKYGNYYDRVNSIYEIFLDQEDSEGNTFRSYIGTDKESQLQNIFLDGQFGGKHSGKFSKYWEKNYGSKYGKDGFGKSPADVAVDIYNKQVVKDYITNNPDNLPMLHGWDENMLEAIFSLDFPGGIFDRKLIEKGINVNQIINNHGMMTPSSWLGGGAHQDTPILAQNFLNNKESFIEEKNKLDNNEYNQTYWLNDNPIFVLGNDIDLTPTNVAASGGNFKIKGPDGQIYTININGKKGVSSVDLQNYGNINKFTKKYIGDFNKDGNVGFGTNLKTDFQKYYEVTNKDELLDLGLSEDRINEMGGFLMSPLQLTNTGDDKNPIYMFNYLQNGKRHIQGPDFLGEGWTIMPWYKDEQLVGVPAGSDSNFSWIQRQSIINNLAPSGDYDIDVDNILKTGPNPNDIDTGPVKGAEGLDVKLGNFMKGIGGPTGLIAMALGIKGYQEANKKIRPLEQPGLSPLFKKHLFQSQELAKTGFDPAERRQAQQKIDDAYNTGMDNLIRGTSGDRAKFLAGSGVLDAQKSSALLDFAAKDADQKRANQENFYQMLEFKETFEQAKNAEERKFDLEQQLADKKGAAEMGNAAFSYLANAWNTNNGFLSASNAKALAGMYSGLTTSILPYGQTNINQE